MSKNPKKTNSSQSFEDSINKTNPVTLLREFLTGIYTIIDDLLTIYVSIYNIIDKLTDSTTCKKTLPQILNSICSLENKINSAITLFKRLPELLKDIPQFSIIFNNITVIQTVVNTLFGVLTMIKEKIIRDTGLPTDIRVCAEGKKLVAMVCVHLEKINKNKLLKLIKKIGGILVIFKQWFNMLEPLFRLEGLSLGNIINHGDALRKQLSPEIMAIGKDLDSEVSGLKTQLVQNNEALASKIQVGGESSYNFIRDPFTKQIYYINSPNGIRVLNIYRKKLQI